MAQKPFRFVFVHPLRKKMNRRLFVRKHLFIFTAGGPKQLLCSLEWKTNMGEKGLGEQQLKQAAERVLLPLLSSPMLELVY